MAKIEDHMDIDNIGFLLNYCSKTPEIYNEVANRLYNRFKIRSAELVLLVTYFVVEERREHGKSQ